MGQAQTIEQDKFEHAKSNAAGWLASIEEMLQALDATAGDDQGYHDDPHEVARRAIEESVLSVQVRDDWHAPWASQREETRPTADEFEILLTTGGPALRIWGKLDDYAQPKFAELQMQDWGTPWTHYPAPEATLLKFASCFYFGE